MEHFAQFAFMENGPEGGGDSFDCKDTRETGYGREWIFY